MVQKCIASWKHHCPGYEIKEWNEENFSITNCPAYVQEAYSEKLWAFVTDYARLKIVYDHGGIYLDTDVELLKPLDKLLKFNGFFGYEDPTRISTGLGFGSVPQLPLLLEMMEDYHKISFYNADGSVNYTTCPDVNTHVFVRHGLWQNNKKQMLEGNVLILPTEYLCPIHYETDILFKTFRTISIHWFSKSWMTEESIIAHKARTKEVLWDFFIHFPNRILVRLIGKDRYKEIKRAFIRKKE